MQSGYVMEKLPYAMEVPGQKREKRGRERGRAAERKGRREKGRENEEICPLEDERVLQ